MFSFRRKSRPDIERFRFFYKLTIFLFIGNHPKAVRSGLKFVENIRRIFCHSFKRYVAQTTERKHIIKIIFRQVAAAKIFNLNILNILRMIQIFKEPIVFRRQRVERPVSFAGSIVFVQAPRPGPISRATVSAFT